MIRFNYFADIEMIRLGGMTGKFCKYLFQVLLLTDTTKRYLLIRSSPNHFKSQQDLIIISPFIKDKDIFNDCSKPHTKTHFHSSSTTFYCIFISFSFLLKRYHFLQVAVLYRKCCKKAIPFN